MNKAAVVVATAGILGLSAIATPAPAQARPWGWGPAIAGGLIAGAALGTAAAVASPWGGPYGYYDGGYSPAFYGGYGPGYYDDSFAYDVDVAPAYTSYAVEPAFVGPTFGWRRSVAFYGGPRWHRWRPWHRSFALYSGPRWHSWHRSVAFYSGPRRHHRWHRF